MINNQRFLPIGTVVLLKNAEKEIMINAYCVFSTHQTEKKKIYEYGACLYPEGVLDANSICAFNHEEIDKILHLGYESEKQKEFSNKMNANYEAYKQKFEQS